MLCNAVINKDRPQRTPFHVQGNAGFIARRRLKSNQILPAPPPPKPMLSGASPTRVSHQEAGVAVTLMDSSAATTACTCAREHRHTDDTP